jgi:hypothetical protein
MAGLPSLSCLHKLLNAVNHPGPRPHGLAQGTQSTAAGLKSYLSEGYLSTSASPTMLGRRQALVWLPTLDTCQVHSQGSSHDLDHHHDLRYDLDGENIVVNKPSGASFGCGKPTRGITIITLPSQAYLQRASAIALPSLYRHRRTSNAQIEGDGVKASEYV